MNSVANGKIIFNTKFKNIYTSPNPGDAGGSIGSALWLINEIYKNRLFNSITTIQYILNHHETQFLIFFPF